MFNERFYFATTRKIVAAFGTTFNNISLARFNADGGIKQTIKVPLAYGPRHKWLARKNQRNSIDGTETKVSLVLPRMSFAVVGMQYDPARQLSPINRFSRLDPTDSTRQNFQGTPAPYDIQIELNIMTKTMDDGLQIIEQILPMFQPEYTITINEIPEMNMVRDVPIILSDISSDDNYDSGFQDTRQLTWTLNFVAKTNLYPPVSDGDLIRQVETSFYQDAAMENGLDRITVSVDPFDAPESDFDVATSIEDISDD